MAQPVVSVVVVVAVAVVVVIVVFKDSTQQRTSIPGIASI